MTWRTNDERRKMNWFKASAPIRTKLMFSYGLLTSIVLIVTISTAVAGSAFAIGIGIAGTLIAAAMSYAFREAIAQPYVTTVVRMEALAKGDLTSPIEFTNFEDCVGRLTKAMFAFRDLAATQVALNGEAEANATIVRTMSENMARLADGDLSADITRDFPPAYADLKAGFNEALVNLRRLIGGVTHSAAGIRTGSFEIAQASEDLARRTESNAASLEQTSAALAQIDERLRATAASSAQTVRRADQAMTTVTGGRATAVDAVTAMGRVSDSAKGIDSVIEGLDKIAFQTRVLAMNAAVEAGRAGDAGRGFAVVADLVSALAMRAEEEAKRARDQLSVTQTDIVTAVQAVEKVDAALADISNDVDEVNKLLATIAADTTIQSTAVTEISAAIGSMDQSTQQNAAMVEQTSAAARNLTAEVGALSDQAAMFKTGESATRTAVMPSPVNPASVHPPRHRAGKAKATTPEPYRSPVKALPTSATPQSASTDDWNAF